MKHTLTSILLGLSLLLLACGEPPSDVGETAQNQTIPELNVGHVGHDHQLALYVAAQLGEKLESDCGAFMKEVKAFEVYDLMQDGNAFARLHLVKVGGGSRMPASMERGEIHIGLGGVAPVAFFVDKGDDFKIVSPLQTDGDMLVMKPDYPASDWASFVQTFKQNKKPLKIGYKAPVAVAKLIFERALKEESIPVSAASGGDSTPSIELINLQGAGNAIPSLANNAVDGFVINQPYASMAVDKKAGKIVCDLSSLPPAGKWEGHPCCCVAALKTVINENRIVLKTFLKVLHAATQRIASDPGTAFQIASDWTKAPLSVEKDSVPTVRYSNEPSPQWLQGMKTWAQIMNEIGKFTGTLKDKSPDEIVDLVCDLSLIREIVTEAK